MKSLFYTILILGGAFAAYDYFGAPPGKKIIFKSLNPPEKTGPKLVLAHPVNEDMPVVKEAPPETAKPAAETAKAMEKAPASTSAPAAVTKPASDPRFQPIEALTGNWMKIPASAFPREVKLLQDAMFKMSVGGSKVAAGGKAFAIGADNGVLTLAPTATSPARAQLPIDGTDLKAQLNESYEKWKVVRAEELKKIAANKPQSAPVAASTAGMVDGDGKPLRDNTSAYPLLVSAMKNGEVSEVKPENILRWYDPQPAQVQGKQGWAVKFECNVKTIFGLQPVEAQAVVLNGKVMGWYYIGSGEAIP